MRCKIKFRTTITDTIQLYSLVLSDPLCIFSQNVNMT